MKLLSLVLGSMKNTTAIPSSMVLAFFSNPTSITLTKYQQCSFIINCERLNNNLCFMGAVTKLGKTLAILIGSLGNHRTSFHNLNYL